MTHPRTDPAAAHHEDDRPTVLVTGGSIAGPAQAWALTRAGFRVTLQERSPAVREAGQNIDVRDAGHEVLRMMGIHDAVAANTTGEVGTRFLDRHGRTYAELPVRTGSGTDGPTAELEILRGKLSAMILELTEGQVEHRYGNHVVELDQDDDAVHVRFADGARETYDLVVVAEGRSSATRDLALGDDVEVRSRGQYIAYGTIPRTDADDDWWSWLTATDSRMVALRPDDVGTIRAQLSFLAPDLGLQRLPHESLMQVLRARFAGVGWQTERVLDGFAAAPDELYLERTDRVALRRYSRGRVIVVGDAAWAGGPTGMGTTLALVGAHVLAGELHAARTRSGLDHTAAFAAYERLMRPYAEKVQTTLGSPRVVLPRTTRGLAAIAAVHRVAASRWARDLAERALLSRAGGSFDLPRYDYLGPRAEVSPRSSVA